MVNSNPMGKKVVVLVSIVSLTGLGLMIISRFLFRSKEAGVLIDSKPESSVFINGELMGRTRLDTTLGSSEITVKLVPQDKSKKYSPYETKLKLTPQVKTVLLVEFSDRSEEEIGVAQITFEKTNKDGAPVSIISSPSNATVLVDGVTKGYSPLLVNNLQIGEHVITLTSEGYASKEIRAQNYKGYQLIAFFKLSKEKESNSQTLPPLPTASPEKKLVQILDTPTGFLRVRDEPASTGKEIGQVESGKEYLYMDTDFESGWFKIEYEKGKYGWIINKFAQMSSMVPTPSATPQLDLP